MNKNTRKCPRQPPREMETLAADKSRPPSTPDKNTKKDTGDTDPDSVRKDRAALAANSFGNMIDEPDPCPEAERKP